MSDVEKLVRDGKVAVLYSPRYGAGWSTWAGGGSSRKSMAFDRELAEAVLAGDEGRIHGIAKRKWPSEYHGGLRDIKVAWVEEGVAFRINEYDGSESIEIIGEIDSFTA